MIAIHAHAIPFVFPPRRAGAKPTPPSRRRCEHREDWRRRRCSPSIPRTPRITTTRSWRCPTPTRRTPAASSPPSPSPTSPGTCGRVQRLDREALKRGNSVYFPTASCRCCPSASPTISARSARTRTARPSPSAWCSPPTAGRRHHRFHRIMMRSAAQALVPAGAGRLRRQARSTRRRRSTQMRSPLWAGYRGAAARARDAREPLDLDLPERKVDREARTAPSSASCVPERLEAHRLIEEFMIQANVAAAESAGSEDVAARLPHPRRRPRWRSSRRCANS